MLENLIFVRTLFVGTVDDNRIYDIQGTLLTGHQIGLTGLKEFIFSFEFKNMGFLKNDRYP
jgi:hypothetical protein